MWIKKKEDVDKAKSSKMIAAGESAQVSLIIFSNFSVSLDLKKFLFKVAENKRRHLTMRTEV